ncbi:2'-5' RNA ligase family protein [Frateuria sp. GZRe14]|uniref:2'-5' RNA ligase family protein n=1 Tax=Frateuria sp. GZRe14 TaxID=3351534 RepID=UPI003EDC9784
MDPSFRPLHADLFGTGWKPGDGAQALYFALVPDDVVKAKIVAAQKAFALRFGLRAVIQRDLLHLTLCAPSPRSRIREPLPVALAKAADRLAFSAVDVRLTTAARFGGALGRSSWVLRAEGEALLEMRRALAKAMGLEGMQVVNPRSFAPHVTVAYSNALPKEEVPMEPICWNAQDFVLIHSHFGGSRHDVLGRWALAHQA